MRFFPQVFKQPLLGMELKKQRKEKEEDRKFKNLQVSKKPVHIGLKIVFIVGQREVSGRQLQSSQTRILVLINFYWLTYTKNVKEKMNNT